MSVGGDDPDRGGMAGVTAGRRQSAPCGDDGVTTVENCDNCDAVDHDNTTSVTQTNGGDDTTCVTCNLPYVSRTHQNTPSPTCTAAGSRAEGATRRSMGSPRAAAAAAVQRGDNVPTLTQLESHARTCDNWAAGECNQDIKAPCRCCRGSDDMCDPSDRRTSM